LADIPLQQVLSAPVVIWASLEQLRERATIVQLENTMICEAPRNVLSVLTAKLQTREQLRARNHHGNFPKIVKQASNF
jgi:hypothetical protein